jgi:hypothetical protein
LGRKGDEIVARPLLKHEIEKRTPLEEVDGTISWDNVPDASMFMQMPLKNSAVAGEEQIGRRDNSEWISAGVSTGLVGAAIGGSVYAFGATSTLIGVGVVFGGVVLLVNWAVGNTFEL